MLSHASYPTWRYITMATSSDRDLRMIREMLG